MVGLCSADALARAKVDVAYALALWISGSIILRDQSMQSPVDAIYLSGFLVRVGAAVFGENPPVRKVGKRVCDQARPLSPPLTKSEHDGKEKSRQSSEQSFRNGKVVECTQTLAGQDESCVRHHARP